MRVALDTHAKKIPFRRKQKLSVENAFAQAQPSRFSSKFSNDIFDLPVENKDEMNIQATNALIDDKQTIMRLANHSPRTAVGAQRKTNQQNSPQGQDGDFENQRAQLHTAGCTGEEKPLFMVKTAANHH